MRNRFLTLTATLICFIFMQQRALADACTFISPTVNFISITSNPATGKCEYLVDLSFDLENNSGNKYIFIHLWELSRYHKNSSGAVDPYTYPTSTGPGPGYDNILFSSAATIGIDNFGLNTGDNFYDPVTNPIFYDSYLPGAPDPGVTPQMLPKSGNPDNMYITKTAVGPNFHYIVHNVRVVMDDLLCYTGQLPVFKGDTWSGNQGSGTPQVMCAYPGFAITPVSPVISGTLCANTNRLKFTVAKADANSTVTFEYQVYLDKNGDHIFNPVETGGTDIIISNGGSNSALYTLDGTTPSITFDSQTDPSIYPASYFAANPGDIGKDVFISLVDGAVDGTDYERYLLQIKSDCSLPVVFGGMRASMHDGRLTVNWQSMSEIDCREYLIEGSTDGANFHTIGAVRSKAPNGNSTQTLNYEFTTSVPGSLAAAGLLLSLLLIPAWRSRMGRALLVIAFLAFVGACVKGSKEIDRDATPIYIRITQLDNEPGSRGTVSGVIKVVND